MIALHAVHLVFHKAALFELPEVRIAQHNGQFYPERRLPFRHGTMDVPPRDIVKAARPVEKHRMLLIRLWLFQCYPLHGDPLQFHTRDVLSAAAYRVFSVSARSMPSCSVSAVTKRQRNVPPGCAVINVLLFLRKGYSGEISSASFS